MNFMRWSLSGKTFKYKQISLTPLGLLTLTACGGGGGGGGGSSISVSTYSIGGHAVAVPID